MLNNTRTTILNIFHSTKIYLATVWPTTLGEVTRLKWEREKDEHGTGTHRWGDDHQLVRKSKRRPWLSLWLTRWYGIFFRNTHVSPKWRIQSSLEAKPKQFHSLGSISGQAMVWEWGRAGSGAPEGAWEASDPNQAEPNNQASGPRDGGAAQALEKKSGQTASTTGGRASSHSHIILSSSSQPAGWIHLDSVGGTILHPHWEAVGAALGDQKAHGREKSRGGAGQKITPGNHEWLYQTETQTLYIPSSYTWGGSR